jgi:hypothetical protein
MKDKCLERSKVLKSSTGIMMSKMDDMKLTRMTSLSLSICRNVTSLKVSRSDLPYLVIQSYSPMGYSIVPPYTWDAITPPL